jgi:hypothetical protein
VTEGSFLFSHRELEKIMLHRSDLPADILSSFGRGVVIPAHVMASTDERKFDPVRQRAITRYYLDAGAGGVAVGVHTTQFGIRAAGLYEPVLKNVAETVERYAQKPVIKVAGVTGKTDQALKEAEVARRLGYHAALLNVAAFKDASEDEIIDHCEKVSRQIPLIGFYLLTQVGGIYLSEDFWRRFCQIDNVIGIKIAPFNRYFTGDVVRGLVAARAEDRITVYTGNDDHIVLDLLTPFIAMRDDAPVTVRMRGGLLGHWAIWTRCAVEQLEKIHAAVDANQVTAELLALDSIVTDCNRAIYDAKNDFRGCVPGCHEVLRRQGLMQNTLCLDPAEVMSPGQAEAIDAVYRQYPDQNDDQFVAANLERWLAE